MRLPGRSLGDFQIRHGELLVSALPILHTDHEPPARLLPQPYVILSNARDLLLWPLKSRSFTEFTLERSEGFRMTC